MIPGLVSIWVREQIRYWNFERLSQSTDVEKCDVALASLHAS